MAPSADLPAPPSLTELAQAGPLALFLDFDGTLVAIAPGPDEIEVPADMAQRLAELAGRHDGRLAVVSGRSPDDLKKHLGKLTVGVAGSHGAARFDAEGNPLGKAPGAISADITAAAQDGAQALGLKLERKTHGVALHFRDDPEREQAAEDLAADLAERFGLARKYGKCVIELTEAGAEKGGAVHAFMEEPEFRDATPIFVGDDVTDEDGFRACNELGGFGIAVGERPSENARYRLADVGETHSWLGLYD